MTSFLAWSAFNQGSKKFLSFAVAAFKKILWKNTKPDSVWVDQGTQIGGVLEAFCRKRDIKIYSTRSGKKATVTEGANTSLKNVIFCYMEENVEKYFNKMGSFVNFMNTRGNRAIGKAPKKIKIQMFLIKFLEKAR